MWTKGRQFKNSASCLMLNGLTFTAKNTRVGPQVWLKKNSKWGLKQNCMIGVSEIVDYTHFYNRIQEFKKMSAVMSYLSSWIFISIFALIPSVTTEDDCNNAPILYSFYTCRKPLFSVSVWRWVWLFLRLKRG